MLQDYRRHNLKKKAEDLRKKADRLEREARATDRQVEELRLSRDRAKDAWWKKTGLPPAPANLGHLLLALTIRTEAGAQHADEPRVLSEVINPRLEGYPLTYALDFGVEWRKDSYARVQVSHKLAAALMLTQVPADMSVKAPWDHWVLEVPDGLAPMQWSPSAFKEANPEEDDFVDFSSTVRGDEVRVDIRALVCQGSEVKQLLAQGPNGYAFLTVSSCNPLLTAYVKGACLSMHDRKHVQEKSWGKVHAAGRNGPPSEVGRQYVLSKPVAVDFREEVGRLMAGEKRQGPKVQFLVRGHWRNQACGKGRQDHRVLWIEPFWKGPEESRILLRSHSLT